MKKLTQKDFDNWYLTGNKDFSSRDLSGLKLIGLDLKGSSFSGSNLNGSKLVDCDFTRANLRYCKFKNSKLLNCNLKYANLKYVYLKRTDFKKVNLTGANLSCDLIGAYTIENCYFREINFTSVTLNGYSIPSELYYSLKSQILENASCCIDSFYLYHSIRYDFKTDERI